MASTLYRALREVTSVSADNRPTEVRSKTEVKAAEVQGDIVVPVPAKRTIFPVPVPVIVPVKRTIVPVPVIVSEKCTTVPVHARKKYVIPQKHNTVPSSGIGAMPTFVPCSGGRGSSSRLQQQQNPSSEGVMPIFVPSSGGVARDNGGGSVSECLLAHLHEARNTTAPVTTALSDTTLPQKRTLPPMPKGEMTKPMAKARCKQICDLYPEVFNIEKGEFLGAEAVMFVKEGQ